MSKQRYIDTKFWDDPYINELSPTEKLLYLYLLTNTLTSLCGIYEISLKRISFDTGISTDLIKKNLENFGTNNKIHYVDGWVYIMNKEKYLAINPSIQIGVDREKALIPPHIRQAVDTLYTAWVQAGPLILKPILKPNSIYCTNFEKFWLMYPSDRRIKKDECKKIYTAYCDCAEKEIEFANALNKYKSSEKYKAGFIQNSNTWFRDWKTWLDYEPEVGKNKYEGSLI